MDLEEEAPVPSGLNLSAVGSNLSASVFNPDAVLPKTSASGFNLSASFLNLDAVLLETSASGSNLSVVGSNLSASESNLSASVFNPDVVGFNLSTAFLNPNAVLLKTSASGSNLSASVFNLSASGSNLSAVRFNLSASVFNPDAVLSKTSASGLSLSAVVFNPDALRLFTKPGNDHPSGVPALPLGSASSATQGASRLVRSRFARGLLPGLPYSVKSLDIPSRRPAVPPKKQPAKPALDPSFSATKPISAWNRPIKLDAKGLFGALAKGALHGFTGQWTELGGDGVDALGALGLDSRDASQLSWLLLRRALVAAMGELVRESLPEIEEPEKDLSDLTGRLDQALDEAEVAIDRSLFDRPRNLPLLGVVQAPFAEWLEAYGLKPPAAAAVAQRLPSYFVVALHAEWRRHPGVYEPIQQAVDTPFTRAAERERAWAAYAARLDRQVDEPMFGESFGLRQVYVPLRAFYVEEPARDKLSAGRSTDIERTGSREARRVAVRMEEEIDAWIAKADKQDRYRVLSGGPGSGKSSFLRMYAARAAQDQRIRVLFIPLHQLNVAGSLVAAVGDYVRHADLLPGNPLDPDSGEERLLLLLDGLDELSMQGRIGAEVARDFVREVLKHAEIKNQDRCRLLVLFSGREPVVQASESEFRERRQVLHALPYYIEKAQRQGGIWKSGAEILAEDQRPSWWEAYGRASGRGYTTLPAELKRDDLDEITTQPLLNYLVALSCDRGKLRFTDELNLNDIYRDLLEAVHERGYEQKRSLAPDLKLLEFRRVLEEIALATWHGTGRTTSVAEIQDHCERSGMAGLLHRFEAGAKAGVTRVLTAFYFRQFGQTTGGDPTFEFTHKSFREYLTAIRIIDLLELMQEEMGRRQQWLGGGGWDEAEALKRWAEICGPTRMDRELWVFIAREVKKRGPEVAGVWQTMLCGLISFMLRHGMPMESLKPRPSYHEEARQARNAEEALLAVLNACAETTRLLSRIEWPHGDGDRSDRTAFGAWLKSLQGQRVVVANVLALDCLSFLDLSGQALHFADLLGARLNNADLRDAGLQMTNLMRANLGQANLVGADLEGANLEQANLKWTNLERANLRQANLESANLEGANLEQTNLERANLVGADLERANLERANGFYKRHRR